MPPATISWPLVQFLLNDDSFGGLKNVYILFAIWFVLFQILELQHHVSPRESEWCLQRRWRQRARDSKALLFYGLPVRALNERT
jgi:hypothetical protein